MKQLSPGEFKQWVESKKAFQLLDVRERWEYDIVRFEQATLRPLGFLPINPPELDKEKPVVVYCHHGVRSISGCLIMEQLGFKNVYNLSGGIDLYAQTADNSMPTY
ncbi:sulfurtransferase [bacterium]|nr:sulfurtransferase [bacterium]